MIKRAAHAFLPNEANTSMLPGFLAFCVAAVGVALGFAASAFDWPGVAVVAFGITALGIAGGFVAVAFYWWRLLRRPRRGK